LGATDFLVSFLLEKRPGIIRAKAPIATRARIEDAA
jgi:hypothetical protein